MCIRDRCSTAATQVGKAGVAAGFALDQHSFEATFSAFDPDRSASLNIAEFMGLSVFIKCTANIFSAFDPQRTGSVTLDYNQFVYAVSNCK